jgi:hypothetical protein
MKGTRPVLRLCVAVFTGLVTVATSMAPVIRYEPANHEVLFEKSGLIFYVRGTGPIGGMAGDKAERVADHVDLPFVIRNDGAEPVEFSTRTSTLQIGGVAIPNQVPTVVRLLPDDTKEIYLRFYFREPPLLAREGDVGRVRLGAVVRAGAESPVEVRLVYSEGRIWPLYRDPVR